MSGINGSECMVDLRRDVKTKQVCLSAKCEEVRGIQEVM